MISERIFHVYLHEVKSVFRQGVFLCKYYTKVSVMTYQGDTSLISLLQSMFLY
jgi:hypothetical protein